MEDHLRHEDALPLCNTSKGSELRKSIIFDRFNSFSDPNTTSDKAGSPPFPTQTPDQRVSQLHLDSLSRYTHKQPSKRCSALQDRVYRLNKTSEAPTVPQTLHLQTLSARRIDCTKGSGGKEDQLTHGELPLSKEIQRKMDVRILTRAVILNGGNMKLEGFKRNSDTQKI